MKKLEINNIDLEIDTLAITKFINKIIYPIAIVDFETFRTFQKSHLSSKVKNDFFEKIFSVAFVIFNKPNELSIKNLKQKKIRIFSKTQLPKQKKLDSFETLLPFQMIFYQFLFKKLMRYRVKSLIFLGSRTEVNILRNYLTYFSDNQKTKDKIGAFFYHNQIFDLYDIWNNDKMINLPKYLDKKNSNNKIGATKKTTLLIKDNQAYQSILTSDSEISNHDIGRTIDQYFSSKICLLDNFLMLVAEHNKNDVLLGAGILSFLYNYCLK